MNKHMKLINNSDVPPSAIEALARCFLPDILAYYKSEEGQRKYARQPFQQEVKKSVATEISKD